MVNNNLIMYVYHSVLYVYQRVTEKQHMVGGFNQPLWKIMDFGNVGMMKFPTEWKK